MVHTGQADEEASVQPRRAHRAPRIKCDVHFTKEPAALRLALQSTDDKLGNKVASLLEPESVVEVLVFQQWAEHLAERLPVQALEVKRMVFL